MSELGLHRNARPKQDMEMPYLIRSSEGFIFGKVFCRVIALIARGALAQGANRQSMRADGAGYFAAN
ncbi:hypothetical protein OZ411_36425 [Bradyrhizobium sp. Arg237L]|uniref:hypothetical protein n=1 Tax=Bradyrhizobium sp. Arg237L TaxID=3003352 RepID=UPI00249E71C8|nr:hypothetical protein [Bradyrhizobium sp. Arg237L]MDI4238301.1 hypothetical protein [Bradyrhizobium sp. Arg237L]